MRPRAMVALNLTGTAVFISVFFWLGRDHSPLMLLAAGPSSSRPTLVLPMYWSGKVEAELARLPEPAVASPAPGIALSGDGWHHDAVAPRSRCSNGCAELSRLFDPIFAQGTSDLGRVLTLW